MMTHTTVRETSLAQEPKVSVVKKSRKGHPSEIGDTIRQEVRVRMRELGLNARSLSIKAGMEVKYVGQVLRGKIDEPSWERLERIATALGCTPTDLKIGTMSRKVGLIKPRSKRELLAARFRAARWAWREDLAKAAEELKISLSDLQDMESGTKPIPDRLLVAFCWITECPIGWFQTGDVEDMKPEMAIRIGYRDPSLIPDRRQDS